MTIKKCVLTLDYELFFDKSGTPQACMLNPTEQLLNVLDETSSKATFFVDTIYLNKLKNSNDIKNQILFDDIVNQLQRIVKQGSRIELHLHPHWIDAYQKEEQWIFPSYEHYKLGSLSDETVECLFKEGILLLNEIAQSVDRDYRVMAFRAGGWCVEPFTKLRHLFIANNILIDSSVVSGMKFSGEVHNIDYSSILPGTHYYFSDSVYEQSNTGKFLEIPINGYQLSALNKIVWKVKSILAGEKAKIYGDGIGIRSIERQTVFNKILNLLIGRRQDVQYSLDGYIDSDNLNNAIKRSELRFISLVAHPKTLTQSSLDAIKYLTKIGYSFVSIDNIYHDILKYDRF